MINSKLLHVYHAAAEWCRRERVDFDVVCDEDDVQGILLFKRDRTRFKELQRVLEAAAQTVGVHVRRCPARGGVAFLTSLRALNEAQTGRVRALAERTLARPYAERVRAALAQPVLSMQARPVITLADSFEAAARRLTESQYKPATQGASRANSTSLARQAINLSRTLGGVLPGREAVEDGKFTKLLGEALDGMATPTDQQPVDLFKMFANAMQALGQTMNVGPLQEQLKQRGIRWKLSEDRQALIFYVINAQTKVPQPIATLNSSTLTNPSEFEEQLTQMIDFANGKAPGTLKAERERQQNIEKTVRDIAKSVQPPEPGVMGAQPGMPAQQPGMPAQQPGMPAQQAPAARPGPPPVASKPKPSVGIPGPNG